MATVFVTVGMSPQPFDRLMHAVRPLAAEHSVFVQSGTSSVVFDLEHRPYISPIEMQIRIRSADVVITHAGNTVRLVQRAGKVPIAVARERRFGEMGNDHQVEYLKEEELEGRVIAAWDLSSIPDLVAQHEEMQGRILAERPLPSRADPEHVRQVMNEVIAKVVR